MSISLYGDALLARRSPVVVRGEDGTVAPLEAHRWDGPLDLADLAVVDRVSGATVDLGCGPGRFVEEIAARGWPVLGIDLAPVAVEMTRRRGVHVLQRDLFGHLPGSGRWDWALLIDGNIGIGGDPGRLLRRVVQLLRPGGTLVAELAAPGSAVGQRRVRLESPDETGPWFLWSTVSIDTIAEYALGAGLHCRRTWCRDRRWFVELMRVA